MLRWSIESPVSKVTLDEFQSFIFNLLGIEIIIRIEWEGEIFSRARVSWGLCVSTKGTPTDECIGA